jgi:LysR family transcriptional regulator, flagellar master operon regulator
MDIALLRTFLEVVKRRHFGEAAEVLCITQSAVSVRIKLLESQMGQQLFIRQRKDLQLTPAGNRLLHHAETIVRGWERARQDIALEPAFSSSLALGSTQDLWRILLRERIPHIHRMLPATALQIETHPSDNLVRRLTSHLLDLVFMFEPPMMPGLEMEQVLEIPLVLVASREGLGIDEAMASNYILVDWGNAFALRHAELFAEMPVSSLKVNAGVLALDLLNTMGGSAYLSQRMVQSQLDQGSLFLVKEAPVINRFAFVVYSPGNQRQEILRQALLALRQLE